MSEGIKYNQGKPRLSYIHPALWHESVIAHFTNEPEIIESDNFVNQVFYYRKTPDVTTLVFKPSHDIYREAMPGLEFGARKYNPYNYMLGLVYSELVDAFRRHLTRLMQGEETDPESGLNHRVHAYCNLIMFSGMVLSSTGTDDRPHLPSNEN